MDPLPYAVLSLTIAVIPLLALPAREGRLSLLWDRRHLAPMMALGFLATAVTSLLLFYAGRTVPASRMVILGQVEILIATAFGALILKEPVGAAQLGATALILAGMAVALKAGSLFTIGRGELMILCMPVCFQLSHLISKRLLPHLGPDLVAAGRTFFGLAFLLPLIPFMAPLASWQRCFSNPRALALLLFQGLIINALSVRLWYTSLATVDLSKITTLLLTYPLLTLALAKFLPGVQEPVAPLQFVGAALVVAGGGLMSRLPSRAQAS
jgi:drug/metabolite transporter (DMT)-like permease